MFLSTAARHLDRHTVDLGMVCNLGEVDHGSALRGELITLTREKQRTRGQTRHTVGPANRGVTHWMPARSAGAGIGKVGTGKGVPIVRGDDSDTARGRDCIAMERSCSAANAYTVVAELREQLNTQGVAR